MRGRDQPDVDLDGRLAPDRIDLAILHGTQQLDLHVERQVADLVEEKRAANAPRRTCRYAFRSAPVKEPFSWPNRIDSTRLSRIAPQLTVTNGLERRSPRALDGARHQFLADTGFALDEDRDVGGGGLLRRAG